MTGTVCGPLPVPLFAVGYIVLSTYLMRRGAEHISHEAFIRVQALRPGCAVGKTRSKYGPLSDKVQIEWLSNPEEHDYPATLSYLSLHYDEKAAASFVEKGS